MDIVWYQNNIIKAKGNCVENSYYTHFGYKAVSGVERLGLLAS